MLFKDVKPSHGKLKLANSCWQTQVGVCERHKNSRQTRFYLTPTVCKRVCRLFLCRSHTPTWVCRHEFANLSLPCEGRLTWSHIYITLHGLISHSELNQQQIDSCYNCAVNLTGNTFKYDTSPPCSFSFISGRASLAFVTCDPSLIPCDKSQENWMDRIEMSYSYWLRRTKRNRIKQNFHSV